MVVLDRNDFLLDRLLIVSAHSPELDPSLVSRNLLDTWEARTEGEHGFTGYHVARFPRLDTVARTTAPISAAFVAAIVLFVTYNLEGWSTPDSVWTTNTGVTLKIPGPVQVTKAPPERTGTPVPSVGASQAPGTSAQSSPTRGVQGPKTTGPSRGQTRISLSQPARTVPGQMRRTQVGSPKSPVPLVGQVPPTPQGTVTPGRSGIQVPRPDVTIAVPLLSVTVTGLPSPSSPPLLLSR